MTLADKINAHIAEMKRLQPQWYVSLKFEATTSTLAKAWRGYATTGPGTSTTYRFYESEDPERALWGAFDLLAAEHGNAAQDRAYAAICGTQDVAQEAGR